MNTLHLRRILQTSIAAALVAPVVALAAPPEEITIETHVAAPMFERGEGMGHGPLHWGGPGGPGFDGHGPGHGPGGMMARMRHLDLTDAQEDAAFALMHGNGERMYQLHKKAQRSGEALRELGDKESFDAAKARALADELGRAQADLALLRAELHAKFRALLTPEQRARLDKAGPMRTQIRKEIRKHIQERRGT